MKKTASNLADIKWVHFIGIGGIGMSALARYFLHEGKKVSGSDRAPSRITDALVGEGARFCKEQSAANIVDGIDLTVYTEAMPKDHAELAVARAKKILCVSYFEALGLVANPYHLIAVAGTHGKTTTTAMTIDVLEAAGLDPTAVVGSLRAKTKSNFRAGRSKYCVVEACEYRRDFLHLKPDLLVITNIEDEHLDYYRDLADIQDAFGSLVRSVPEEGYIVCNPHDPKVIPSLTHSRAHILDYTRQIDPLLCLRTPGMHNLLDAAAALGVVRALGLDERVAKQTLEDFTGVWRRSEYIGETKGGALIFDDYAHHPTEIAATLNSFRERYPKRRMIVAFQPHLRSRTEDFFERFVETLAIADEVVLAPIFDARTEADSPMSSEMLAEALEKKTGKRARAFGSYPAIAEYLAEHCGANDLIITMGAGAINTVAEMITGKK